MGKRRQNSKNKDFYIDKKELVVELNKWKKSGDMSDKLGTMLLSIVNGLGQKRNFSGYTYIDDMKGMAIEFLVKYARNFNDSKPNSNAFSYCTQIAYCAFIQYIQKEKKQSTIKKQVYDDLITKKGMMHLTESPFDTYIKNCGDDNRIKEDLIEDLIQDYDLMIDILKKEIKEKIEKRNNE